MRGSIRRRSKGSWELTIDLGRDPISGKRERRFLHVKGTRKDAEHELTTRLHALATGSYVDASKETVAGYLDRWLRDYAKSNVAPRTYERYEQIVRRHLVPTLGQLRLNALRPLHIVAAEQQWLESGNARIAGAGLSARTVLHHHRVLREALQQAVKWQALVSNPADAVTPPRASRREMTALDVRQAAALLDAARGADLELPITALLYTGLRVGELLGLRWQDVDLDAGRLSIRQTMQRVTGGGVTFRSPKTHRSRRTVSLPAVVVQALREARRGRIERALRSGAAWHESNLVFMDAVGRPVSQDHLRNALRQLLRQAGLPLIRLHDLRHTHATLMLSQGEHPKVVSERLGHATVGITLDTYSHVLPGLQEAAADRLAAALDAAAAVGSPSPR